MSRRPYGTDLSDAEWATAAPHLPRLRVSAGGLGACVVELVMIRSILRWLAESPL